MTAPIHSFALSTGDVPAEQVEGFAAHVDSVESPELRALLLKVLAAMREKKDLVVIQHCERSHYELRA